MTSYNELPGLAEATRFLHGTLAPADLFKRITPQDSLLDWMEAPAPGMTFDAEATPLDGPVAVHAPADILVALRILQLRPVLSSSGNFAHLAVPTHLDQEGFARAHAVLFKDDTSGKQTTCFQGPAPDARRDRQAADFANLRRSVLAGQPVFAITCVGVTLPDDLAVLADQDLSPATITRQMLIALLTVTHSGTGKISVKAVETALPSDLRLRQLSVLQFTVAFAATDAIAVARRLRGFGTEHAEVRGAGLEDVFGQPQAVAAFRQIGADLQDWERGNLAWSDVTSSILLYGPPGTGKTMLPAAFATSAGIKMIETSFGRCQQNGHMGDMLAALNSAVTEAIAHAPAVFFLDEIDAFYSRDGGSGSHINSYMNNVVTSLLTQIDRLNKTPGVIFVAATNYPDRVDEAVLRAGRLDRHIAVGPLSRTAICELLQKQTGLEACALEGAVMDQLVGSTGAQIDSFLRKARTLAREMGKDVDADVIKLAARTYLTPVDTACLERVAIHEAGHLLATHLLCDRKQTLVRITPHGGEVRLPARGYHTQETVRRDVICLLAGRAAERLLLGNVSSGAGAGGQSDLALATELALKAALQWQLDDRIDLWLSLPDDLSQARTRHIKTARQQVQDAELAARALLANNRRALREIADQVLEKREIEGHNLLKLLDAATAENPPQSAPQT